MDSKPSLNKPRQHNSKFIVICAANYNIPPYYAVSSRQTVARPPIVLSSF